MSGARVYKNDDVLVQIKGLDAGPKVRVHLEHKSGAALIVPDCDAQVDDRGFDFSVVGFDGIRVQLNVDEHSQTLRIVASSATPLLGDKHELVLARAADLSPPVELDMRITGDEVTRPIDVKR